MNIVVIGPGALGSLFSARLAAAGQDVTLLDHNQERATSLANRLVLTTADQTIETRLTITADSARLARADIVLLTVKSQHLAELMPAVCQQTAANAIIIGLQNGIGHLHLFEDSASGLALGVTAQGATLIKAGHVRHGGSGPTAIGFLHPNQAPESATARLEKIAELLSQAGLATEVVANIEERLWQKLLINVGINGLTVLYNCSNGDLLEITEARDRLTALVTEGIEVARRKGIKLDGDPVARTLEVCKATAANTSSMLQDVRNNRPTEIMAINGALVAEAEKLAVPVPENALLVKEILAKKPATT